MAFMIKKKRYKFQVNLCLEELSEVTYRYDFAICILYFFIKKHPIFVHGNRRINQSRSCQGRNKAKCFEISHLDFHFKKYILIMLCTIVSKYLNGNKVVYKKILHFQVNVLNVEKKKTF